MTLLDYLAWKELTQAQFAELVGLSKSAISLVANGKRTPSAKVAKAIVKATGGAVSLDEALFGAVNKRGRAAA